MSLYGPRINIPRVDIPNPANPSWNLDKEKKAGAYILIVIIILIILYFTVPILLNILGSGIDNLLNPAIVVNWKNNPLNITQQVKEAEMDITITNTQKTIQNVEFIITTSSQEILYICPNSIYDTNKQAYVLENLAPQDKRVVSCIVRRNPQSTVFTGSYTINIYSNFGDIKTTLDIITK